MRDFGNDLDEALVVSNTRLRGSTANCRHLRVGDLALLDLASSASGRGGDRSEEEYGGGVELHVCGMPRNMR